MLTRSIDRWFVSGPPTNARSLLFCLPYAGGGASAFRAWPKAFPSEVGIQAVQLPGRESRISEDGDFSAAQIADAILRRADRPYAIYGHSMGGRLGFEVVRELRRRGATQPARLYVGGSRPPDQVEPLSELARVGDDELIVRVIALGGVAPEVFEVPELRELVLPTLRADFGWIDRYRFAEEDPVPVPLTAFAGATDAHAPADELAGWARHAGAGFDLQTLPGGHFFLNEHLDVLADRILATLPH